MLAPRLEHADQFVALFGLDRHRRASAERVDRDPSQPVELETVTTWDVVQPAMGIFEVFRLES